ncbi:MAG: hypothetical protein RR682_01705, partial [Cetobacterium sp.]
EELSEIIEEIRLKLPDELKQAKRIKDERLSILNEAQAEADKLMKEAVEQEFVVWNENIESAKKVAIENGAKFIDIDIKPFQEKVKPLQEIVINSSDVTKDIYLKIRNLAN